MAICFVKITDFDNAIQEIYPSLQDEIKFWGQYFQRVWLGNTPAEEPMFPREFWNVYEQ